MDAKDFVAARSKFVDQLQNTFRPWHRATPLYNIACCDALLGQAESAVSFLEQAIQSGFRDVEHIKTDPDLDSLRELEGFKTLINKLTCQDFQPPVYRCPWARSGPSPSHRQSFELQQQALKCMESGTPEGLTQAKELFEKQSKSCSHPWGQRIPLYNIACCEALLGNPESALHFLREAINTGYRNLKHIQGDDDLKSLRDLDEFKEIISSIKSGHRCRRGWRRDEPVAREPLVEPSVETNEQPVAMCANPAEEFVNLPADKPVEVLPEAEPIVPFGIPEEYKDQFETLSEMGFGPADTIMVVLHATEGNVDRALDMLLQ